jgi:hypothetical protein
MSDSEQPDKSNEDVQPEETDLPATIEQDLPPAEVARIGDTIKDLGQRVPSYAKLSYNLVSAGKMSGAQQNQILGPLGYGPASKISRFVPILNQLTRILSMVGTIRFVLTQMDVETANEHLASVGLSREPVEADFEVTRDLARHAKAVGSREAARVLETGSREAGRALEVGGREASKALTSGARVAGRLTGKGIRSFRNWQARSPNANTDPDQ